MRPDPDSELLERGEFVRLAYRLGHQRATGVLTVRPDAGDTHVLLLRRGHVLSPEHDDTGRRAAQQLAHIAGLDSARYQFDGGTAAYPPGGATRQFCLAAWARRHLESQIDSARAQELVRLLAGSRLELRRELVPGAALLDDTDQRILAAMSVPRRIDQIWPLARTPRFRLVTFLHFLREVGALDCRGVAAPPPRYGKPGCTARLLLGVGDDAGKDEVKRAYRRLARALHPDLHPSASADRRRLLANKFHEVTAAYRQLVDGPWI